MALAPGLSSESTSVGSPRARCSTGAWARWRASPASGGATASGSRLRPARCSSPRCDEESGAPKECQGSVETLQKLSPPCARRPGTTWPACLVWSIRRLTPEARRAEDVPERRDRREPFTRRGEMLLGPSRGCERVLVTYARSARARRTSLVRRIGACAEDNAAQRTSRNAKASAGVKPAAPELCGHRCSSERAETRAHVVEKISCGLQKSVGRTGDLAASPPRDVEQDLA